MIKAVLFDTFGTIVDWRSSIAREGAAVAVQKGLAEFDSDGFARAWRAGYRPGMTRVTAGERSWVSIDVIHRERLDEILPQFGLPMLDETERDHLNRAWHRLTPWPDSVPGLKRIKSKFLISPLSNGSVVLLSTIAKRSGIPWDFIFSSDMHRAFKRNPAGLRLKARCISLEKIKSHGIPERFAMVDNKTTDPFDRGEIRNFDLIRFKPGTLSGHGVRRCHARFR